MSQTWLAVQSRAVGSDFFSSVCVGVSVHARPRVLMVLTLPTLQATGELLCEISLFMHSPVYVTQTLLHFLTVLNSFKEIVF